MVVAIAVICITAFIFWAYIGQMGETELTLGNYPKLFEKEVLIVIGENASQMEYESAEAIAEKLHEITGHMPVIKSDIELTEGDKANYNLILVGLPRTNGELRDIYEITGATKVTEEYPGESKGILEILRNPWNEDKAMLLVAGSDESGVKAGSEILLQAKENTGCVFVKWEDFEAKTIKFDSLSNPYNFSNPMKTAKLALNEKYGENWDQKYQVGGQYQFPSIPFNHCFVGITPSEFSILITEEEIFSLSPEDFNNFVELYGKSLGLREDQEVINLFETYLRLYGIGTEELFTENHLEKYWISQLQEKYKIDPKEFTNLDIKREGSYWVLDCYTVTIVRSYPRIPSSALDVIFSHYSVKIGNKGDVYLSLINRTKYEEVIQYE